MTHFLIGRSRRSLSLTVLVVICMAAFSFCAWQPAFAADALRVDGTVALASLIALSDNTIMGVADSLQTLADSDMAGTGKWETIQAPLAALAKRSIPAVTWFALPDGTYWTVETGLAAQKLADRSYFPRLLAGDTVIGDLVISKSSGKSVAIVAVPVQRKGIVIGALGCSIYLDKLSDIVGKQMNLDKSMIFYSFDAQPLVGIAKDPQVIFMDPMKQNNPSLERAFREMLQKKEGTVNYDYDGQNRTVIYKKSTVTNWWYAFGLLTQDMVTTATAPRESTSRSVLKAAVHIAASGLCGIAVKADGTYDAELIRKFVNSVRFLDDQTGYFYVYDSATNVCIAHAILPDFVGKDKSDYIDSRGMKVIQELSKLAKARPNGGFLNFYWMNPQTRKEEKKLGYVEMLPGTTLYLGSGVYVKK